LKPIETAAHLHLPREIAGDVHNYIVHLHEEFGSNLISVTGFGCSVTGEYVHWKSDVNLLIILRYASAEQLAKAANVTQRWLRRLPLDPVILTPADLERSRDVIPVELVDWHHRHQALYGPDPLAEIDINGQTLRVELEYSFRKKLARLRSHYLRVSNNERDLTQLLTGSIESFLSQMTCMLFLHGKTPPLRVRELCTQLRFDFDLDGDILYAIAMVKVGQASFRRGEPALAFQRYLTCVEKMIDNVDALEFAGA